jgi:hypothetical protein
MAITDYIPNVFGSAAPTTYEGLLGMGLISPEQMKQTQNTANIQGLLGAGLALAQGMSKIGPRRSAAENILGALSGGFGAAGGAYQQGLQNVIQQQQLQSAALTQAQATNKLKSMQQAKALYPDLAPLADIDPSEFVKQVIARDRAKMYGFGDGSQAPQMPAEAAMPTQAAPQVRLEPGLSVTSKGERFVGVPNFTAGEKYLDENLNQQARQSLQQKQAQPQNIPLVDPANVAQANKFRKNAAFAFSMGDEKMGKFFTDEADRIDPKEQLFFRDGRLISSKRGEIANYGGGRILSDADATQLGLDPNRGKWTIKDNIPSLVSGTSNTKILTSKEAKDKGLDIAGGKTYQMNPDGKIDLIQGSATTATKTLTSADATALGFPTDRGQVYQADANGKVDLVQGTMADKEKFTGEYGNLALSMFGTSDIAKLSADQRKKVDTEAEKRGISKAKAGASTIYTGQLSKTTAGDVEKSVMATADAVTRLNNIQFSYRPEYQKIGYRSTQAWNTLKDKVGTLSTAEKTQLTQYSQYKQNSLQNLNQTIKDITGAAMGVQEADRIISTLPNAGTNIFDGDSPTEFEAKLTNAVKQTKYALARKGYALKKGLNWENISLESMPNILKSRGAEIAKQYNLDPNKPADLNTINRQMAAEFGVSF